MDDQPGPLHGSEGHTQVAASNLRGDPEEVQLPTEEHTEPRPYRDEQKQEREEDRAAVLLHRDCSACSYPFQEDLRAQLWGPSHTAQYSTPPLLQVPSVQLYTERCQAAQTPNPHTDHRLLLSSTDVHTILLPGDCWWRHPAASQDSTALLLLPITIAGSGFKWGGKVM